jgi:hypothetical protein
MPDAKRDDNFVTTLLAVSDVDSETPIPLEADPSTKRLKTNSTVSGPVNTTYATDFNGGPVTVGTSPVELIFSGSTQSIFIQSDHDNTSANIWVGKSNIDNTGANAMARLGQGEGLTIDLDDSSAAVYVVSDIAAQKIYKLALT